MANAVEPQTLWLIVTNIALAVVCLAMVGAVVGGVVVELIARRRRRGDSPVPPRRPSPMQPRSIDFVELKSELPDGWPPLRDGAPEPRDLARV